MELLLGEKFPNFWSKVRAYPTYRLRTIAGTTIYELKHWEIVQLAPNLMNWEKKMIFVFEAVLGTIHRLPKWIWWKLSWVRLNIFIKIVKKNIRWLWNKNLTMDLFPTSQIFSFRIFRWSTTISQSVVQLRLWFSSIWNCIGWNIFSSIPSKKNGWKSNSATKW